MYPVSVFVAYGDFQLPTKQFDALPLVGSFIDLQQVLFAQVVVGFATDVLAWPDVLKLFAKLTQLLVNLAAALLYGG